MGGTENTKGKVRVPRSGGAVVRNGVAHMRSDHLTTVEKHHPSEPKKVLPTGNKDSLASLAHSDSPPNTRPKSMRKWESFPYHVFCAVTGKKAFRTGKGKGVVVYRNYDGGKYVKRVGPNVSFHEDRAITNLDCSGFDLRNATFSSNFIKDLNLSGSNLDGSSFEYLDADGWRQGMQLGNLKCENASLRNAIFRNVYFSGENSFRGTDIQGVQFEDVSLEARTTLDMRGTGLTRDQFEQLVDGTTKRWSISVLEVNLVDGSMQQDIIYDERSVDDACEQLGVDKDTASVLLWSGALELRDNITKYLVDPSDYNPRWHHIPQWSIDEMKASQE